MIENREDNFEKNKIFLKKYLYSLKKVERLKEKYLELELEIGSIRSGTISDMPKGGGTPISLDELISRKDELKIRINKAIKQSDDVRMKVLSVIDNLEDVRHCEILEAYFIENLSFEQIAEEYNYSLRHINRMYSQGIRKLTISK
ncbi:MAG: hypothetical protein LKF43_00245 [Streptococcaceae bacterium]|jgi:DNA-directed RNA polymerase specialized sigma subunit|nr:hypothetical protein [Streptococcaceae bacterium]